MSKSLLRHALILSQLKEWLRYSNHLVTDGRFVGHGGYRRPFSFDKTITKKSCMVLSVLENEDGYDDAYMGADATIL